jgi:hypothetical protein
VNTASNLCGRHVVGTRFIEHPKWHKKDVIRFNNHMAWGRPQEMPDDLKDVQKWIKYPFEGEIVAVSSDDKGGSLRIWIEEDGKLVSTEAEHCTVHPRGYAPMPERL